MFDVSRLRLFWYLRLQWRLVRQVHLAKLIRYLDDVGPEGLLLMFRRW